MLTPDPQELAAVTEASSDLVGLADLDGRVRYVNRAGRRLLGLRDDEDVAGRPIAEFHPEWAATLLRQEGMPAALRDGSWRGEGAVLGPDGEVPVSQVILCPRDPGGAPRFFATIAHDVSGRKQQEAERRHLEVQLAQAQKMESIGRLAGGVAHDFNNLLTTILGHVEFAEASLPPAHPARADLVDIARAAERAASLTRQLLAFARRQVVAPIVLDLNTLVLEMDRMLRRLVGESVELVTLPAPGLWPVRADRGLIEQLIVNLVLNARAAMPGGGTLRIETANAQLGEEHALRHPEVLPGDFAVLLLSDTGEGMSEEVLEHLFEPFFATQGPGRGSGLELASSYGIVRQSGGHIWATSGPGRGSTFRVYLPRAADADAEDAEELPPRGNELVLLVEDEPHLRAMAARALRTSGYDVLEAAHGEEALGVAAATREPIALLVTDVVMPRMGGKDLAARLAEARPGLRVLYISGYTDDSSVVHGRSPPGATFLQKPFSATTLARKVREVIDAGRPRRRP